MKKTILDQAKEILYERKQEKERQYGPFKESMDKAATVASIIAGHSISSHDVYAAIIGIKLAREGHAHKSDNILDAIVYLAQMNDEKEEKFHPIRDQINEIVEKNKTSFAQMMFKIDPNAKIPTSDEKSRKKSNSNSRRKTGKTKTWHGRAKSVSRK